MLKNFFNHIRLVNDLGVNSNILTFSSAGRQVFFSSLCGNYFRKGFFSEIVYMKTQLTRWKTRIHRPDPEPKSFFHLNFRIFIPHSLIVAA